MTSAPLLLGKPVGPVGGDHAVNKSNEMKTETKHTPGPWKAYGLAIYTEAKRQHWVSPRDPRLSLIGNARDNDPEDPEAVDYNAPEYAEAAANARLLASAPELLEALEGLVDDYRKLFAAYQEKTGEQAFGWGLLSAETADKAIAKARGEKGGAL